MSESEVLAYDAHADTREVFGFADLRSWETIMRELVEELQANTNEGKVHNGRVSEGGC